MQFLKLLNFSFNSYLERRNALANNPNRFEILQCPKLEQYLVDSNKDYFEQIVNRLENRNRSDYQKLKLLMMIHFALANGKQTDFSKIIEFNPQSQQEQLIKTEAYELRISIRSKFKQLVSLYLSFIQKICSMPEVYQQIPLDQQINSFQYSANNCRYPIEQTYILINLIKSTASINKIVMFFGRYAKQQYPLIIDFTILISYDLSRIYKYLQSMKKWMMSNFDLFTQQQKKLVIGLTDQILSARQLVEYFIYNKYYYQFIDLKCIKDVVVDKNIHKNIKKVSLATLPTQAVDLSNFQKTYFILANQNQQKKGRIRTSTKSTIY